MTSRQTYNDSGFTYTVSLDERLRAGRLTQSIVSVELRDEHTGQSPAAEVTAHTDFPKLSPKSTPDGIAGLTGIPERALPQLTLSPYDVDFTVTARRYVPFATTVHFAAQPAFPDAFARADLGVVEMHRASVELRGRVVRVTAAGTVPIAAASVSISGYWLQIPQPAAAPPPTAPNLISLQPDVYIARSTATAQVRRRDLAPTGDISELLDDAPAGADSWRLSNRIGLAPGELLQIDAADPGRNEFLIVQSVTGSSSPDQPAQITLRYPGRLDHRPGAVVERVTAAAPGLNNALVSDASAGDAALLTAALAGIAGASTIEITDGIAPPEYHLVSQISVLTDPGGFFRLPALNRVGQLELAVDDGVNPIVHVIVVPNYELAQNIVNIALN